MRIPERSDRIKPLLIGHNEQYVGPGQRHLLFKREAPRSNWIGWACSTANPHLALTRPPLPDRERIEVRVRACFHSEPCTYGFYVFPSSLPVRRRNASRYFADVFSITSFGSRGAGGILSQSSVSRFFLIKLRPPPRSTLFPYTTLFQSR